MFSLPTVSPPTVLDTGEVAYTVAYYQASSPLDSRDSSYKLMLIDRDGSNRRSLFPADGQPGLKGDDIQHPASWAPDGARLAVLYQGNLWLVDVSSSQGQQLTGDGQVRAYDWKP